MLATAGKRGGFASPYFTRKPFQVHTQAPIKMAAGVVSILGRGFGKGLFYQSRCNKHFEYLIGLSPTNI